MRRTSLDVVDQELLSVKEVPTHLVRHTPPARLNVARLMFCRDYRPGEEGSCGMGDGCKFVHADVDPATLESHPIHVKYAWRSEELCTYPRLPAGSVLRVTAPNNRPPIEEIASERVLVTRGALGEGGAGPLSHCAHYYFNRMCNRGERCNFIHAVHVDPSVASDYEMDMERHVISSALLASSKRRGKTAPTGDAGAVQAGRKATKVAAASCADAQQACTEITQHVTKSTEGELPAAAVPADDDDGDMPPPAVTLRRCVTRYRRDPYSFKSVTVPV